MARTSNRKKILFAGIGAIFLALLWLGWRYAPINFVGSNARVDALVEKLASTNQPPVFPGEPPHFFEREFFENPGEWNPLAQKTVSDAYCELESMGKEAFPYLINHFGDERYSHERSFSTYYPVSVGKACESIIAGQVHYGYANYKARETPSGDSVGWEFEFEDYVLGTYGSYAVWWRLNRNRSIREMRIATVEWRSQREKQFGFVSKEQEDDILADLDRKLELAKNEYVPPELSPPDTVRWIDELAYRYWERQQWIEKKNKSEEK